ncbi:MAG: septal ring lytic transglycosylase RlpA family protein [Alphaproteobacteria bacterium]|nr:septal ring lytic transglycosylase RlpA family protein [Alphaproteobacteria bacterium]
MRANKSKMKKIMGILFIVAFILTGCCSTPVTQIANDKLCTGTKRAYQVKGTWYQPQGHYEYEETGVASWYGPHFHGRPKSCGEIFNMHGISAAHKTLPIPSVVRVTNVKTGSSVKLLIDDRGPFVDDRIIDLSKGAASYLGIHDQGLGKVHVQCLPEESQAFAKFVAQYGRYGRDPSGRVWETIFRENFDYEGSAPLPKPLKLHKPHQARTSFHKPKLETGFKAQPFRRQSTKSAPLPHTELNEDSIESEIDDLLKDTRTKLGRRQV